MGADKLGTARRFAEGATDADGGLASVDWGCIGASSTSLRLREDEEGCGVPEERSICCRRCVDGGCAGVVTAPHLDQGGGGGTCGLEAARLLVAYGPEDAGTGRAT